MYDFVVVGCGLFGAVFAQQAKEAGKSVLIVERREHTGGNCHSYEYEDSGIDVHAYGTHIFHCNDQRIWDYVNRFTAFNRYQHRVLTTYQGRVYSMPINLGTINAYYQMNLTPQEVEGFLESKKGTFESPKNLEEKAISLIGEDLYRAFIKGYTMKQWGCDPRELPAAIITRLPVRRSYNDAYFSDLYQGIPLHGYGQMFERLLDGIPVELKVDFFDDRERWLALGRQVVYTGPLDRFFDYQFGRLSWRSVRFEVERVDVDDYQGTSVMNFADPDVPWTRIHEPKHLHLEAWDRMRGSVAVREYSHIDDEEPYYPVNLPTDKEVLVKYQALAAETKNVIFGGRLAQYRYYDMHQVIGAALTAASKALRQ